MRTVHIFNMLRTNLTSKLLALPYLCCRFEKGNHGKAGHKEGVMRGLG